MLLARVLFAPALALAACAGPSPAASTTPEPAVTPAPAEGARSTEPGPRFVVLVRHAEKADESKDPPLTAAGKARAECLADLLAPAAVTDVLSTDYQRTRDTVGPLAAEHGRTVEVLADADATGWVKRLRALPPGAVAVVAGHSNTIPVLVRDLTGQEVTIEPAEYDRMLVLALSEAGGSTLDLRYCTPSGRTAYLLAPGRAAGGTVGPVMP